MIFFLNIIKIKMNNLKIFCSSEINAIKSINLKKYDYIYIFDLKVLYAVSFFINKKKIIWDAREYYPLHYTQIFLWSFFYKGIIEKLIMLSKDKILIGTTVSYGLRKKYYENFKMKLKVKFSVPKFAKLKPRSVSKKILIIHHGICSRTRKIENFFELGKKLGIKYNLFLMLKIVNKQYYYFLKKKYSSVKNVQFIPPVKMRQIPKKINKYDIGLILGVPESVNHLYSMPNKLFEYMQGRLCIISNPLIDIKKFIIQNKVGYTSKLFNTDNVASLIKSLKANDIYKAKINSHYQAKQFNHKILFKDFDKLFKKVLS